ncbi:MAG: hypothetical protein LQ349_006024 [Xanthoria aureola]|nr:MAG: hypothetical protein LQ349_006024 [Xanthoria aureola]
MWCFRRKKSSHQSYDHPPPKTFMSPNPSDVDNLSQSYDHPPPKTTMSPSPIDVDNHSQSRDHPPPKTIISSNPSDVENLSQSFHALSIHPSPASSVISAPSILSTPTPTPTPPPPPQNPTTTTPRPPIPPFPLPTPPRCRTCDSSGTRNTVRPNNRNNNGNRPYYTCSNCKSTPALLARNPQKGWITWDDDTGVDAHNTACFCGWVCRQDRAGRDSPWAGKGFWKCAVGRCGYVSFREDGLTDEEVRKLGLASWHQGFEPTLV